MEILLVVIFVLGYLGIAMEHSFKIDKLIPALAMMAILWALIAVNHLDVFEIIPGVGKEGHHIEGVLLHHLGKTAEILFFLMGAMTIVEIIDYFDGFSTIKSFIRTKSKVRLLWLFSTLAFILSAIIDNLTATIVLITILQKITFQLFFTSMGLMKITTDLQTPPIKLIMKFWQKEHNWCFLQPGN